MADLKTLDKAFHTIILRLAETGRAPHYSELATALGCPIEEGRKVLHDLMATAFPAWLHPGTDLIAAFPPFSNIPTQYQISVRGEQKWFAQ